MTTPRKAKKAAAQPSARDETMSRYKFIAELASALTAMCNSWNGVELEEINERLDDPEALAAYISFSANGKYWRIEIREEASKLNRTTINEIAEAAQTLLGVFIRKQARQAVADAKERKEAQAAKKRGESFAG